jgi:uracil-DNA glycosylase
LREELKQFPNLQAVVILGEDAYQQFQRDVLERHGDEIKPFEQLLKPEGWAQEDVPFPLLKSGTLRVVYCYHPTRGYKHTLTIAPALPRLSP